MSLDYFVICQDSRPILCYEIAQTLALAGWESVTVESFYNERLKLTESPYLSDGNATVGWMKESRNAAFHAALVKTGDQKSIERMCYDETELGHVSWDFKPTFNLSDDVGYDSDEEAAQYIDAVLVGKLKASQCMYGTSYLSNMSFAIAAMATIGKLRSGLIYDPQTGRLFEPPSRMSAVSELEDYL